MLRAVIYIKVKTDNKIDVCLFKNYVSTKEFLANIVLLCVQRSF